MEHAPTSRLRIYSGMLQSAREYGICLLTACLLIFCLRSNVNEPETSSTSQVYTTAKTSTTSSTSTAWYTRLHATCTA